MTTVSLRNHLIKHKHTVFAAIIFFIATALFLWPTFMHIGSYSEGGDHMFNAWTLSRNHHCLTRQGCEVYANGNIYFPNKDSMLYSETQLSTGLLTLPLFLINQNPLFATNVWLLLTVFLAGFFMYLLAKYLSRGNEAISILSGLVFAFAPTKISAMTHLQSLSIFYVPLIFLMLLKYRESGKRKYLIWFGVLSALLFLASWYQMVFGLVIIGVFILYTAFSSHRRAALLLSATLLATLVTIPIAKEYVRFSKENNASFSVRDQIAFSSSVDDYVLPYENTPAGMVYYKLRPFILKNSHNPDNYSYMGVSLYAVLLLGLLYVIKKRKDPPIKETKGLTVALFALFAVGFLFSLGPVLKIGSTAIHSVEGVDLAVPLPYIIVDKLLPRLSFLRAIGRANIISLFALCCLLAILGSYLKEVKPQKKRAILTALLFVIVSLDVLPIKQFITTPFKSVPTRQVSYSIPTIYTKVHDDLDIDNIVILRTQPDYPDAGIPVARVEDVMWSGYHNKNIFNGYSGFEPRSYKETLQDFTDLQVDDLDKMKQLGLRFVIIDKELSQNQPEQTNRAEELFDKKVYEDNRYVLFRL